MKNSSNLHAYRITFFLHSHCSISEYPHRFSLSFVTIFRRFIPDKRCIKRKEREREKKMAQNELKLTKRRWKHISRFMGFYCCLKKREMCTFLCNFESLSSSHLVVWTLCSVQLFKKNSELIKINDRKNKSNWSEYSRKSAKKKLKYNEVKH
jgi:hypothetical protein